MLAGLGATRSGGRRRALPSAPSLALAAPEVGWRVFCPPDAGRHCHVCRQQRAASAGQKTLCIMQTSHERKNWWFVGSQQAGECAAVVMSLIASVTLAFQYPISMPRSRGSMGMASPTSSGPSRARCATWRSSRIRTGTGSRSWSRGG
jgi:hypothetical protein